jgi:hypothetical protein
MDGRRGRAARRARGRRGRPAGRARRACRPPGRPPSQAQHSSQYRPPGARVCAHGVRARPRPGRRPFAVLGRRRGAGGARRVRAGCRGALALFGRAGVRRGGEVRARSKNRYTVLPGMAFSAVARAAKAKGGGRGRAKGGCGGIGGGRPCPKHAEAAPPGRGGGRAPGRASRARSNGVCASAPVPALGRLGATTRAGKAKRGVGGTTGAVSHLAWPRGWVEQPGRPRRGAPKTGNESNRGLFRSRRRATRGAARRRQGRRVFDRGGARRAAAPTGPGARIFLGRANNTGARRRQPGPRRPGPVAGAGGGGPAAAARAAPPRHRRRLAPARALTP